MIESITRALLIGWAAGVVFLFFQIWDMIGRPVTLGPPDHETRAAASAPLTYGAP